MTSTDLATLPPAETALEVYSKEKGLEPYLALVRNKIDEFRPNVETKKGRDQIRSFAANIAKFKTAIDGIGKDESARQKLIPAKIDAERKRAWDILQSWQDEVRKPLTDYEAAEARRIQDHQNKVESLIVNRTEFSSSGEIQSVIASIESIVVDSSMEEFELNARQEKEKSLAWLSAKLSEKLKYEAEQEELRILREQAAEQARKDHEAKIAAEAAEKARNDERERQAQIERDRLAEIEAARLKQLDAEQQVIRANEAAAKAVTDAKIAAEKATVDAAAAQQKAIEDERKRVAAEMENQRKLDEARAKNAAHKKAINNAVLDDLVALGHTAAIAKDLIIALARSKVRHVTINY